MMVTLKVNQYTFRGDNCAILFFASLLKDDQLLTLLHAELPKLYGALAVLSAIGLNSYPYCNQNSQNSMEFWLF